MPGHQHQLYSLVALQIGDIQSYVSRLYVFFACEKSNLIFLVDNGPWSEPRSRPAELWQLILTKSRVSPFANQRLRRSLVTDDGHSLELTRKKKVELVNTGLIKVGEWDKLVSVLRRFCWNLVHSRVFSPLFYGCVAFEVSWEDVRGMNYSNELQTDTCLSLEVKNMGKREFDSLQQALEFYVGECEAGAELQLGKRSISGSPDPERSKRQCLSEGLGFSTPEKLQPSFGAQESPVFTRKRQSVKQVVPVAHTYRDALVVFRFSDPLLPFELREIITSNQRLLQMLESGLPPWVIFLQSYPILSKVYRPWMRPLARTIYFLISVITVMIGFYDLYKNVPVLKATAAHMLGPLFEWIEQWEMVSRLKYLGTMLVLQNYEKAFVWCVMSFKAGRQLVSLLMRPVLEPVLLLWSFVLPYLVAIADGVQALGALLGSVLGSILVAAGYVLNVVAWPFCVFLSYLWSFASAVLSPVVATARVVHLFGVVAGQYAGEMWSSFASNLIKLIAEGYTIVSQTIQLMWLSPAVETPRTPSVWRLLWDDLFSKVFRAVRYILNGLVTFFAAFNRHRLSIYNNMVAFLVRLIRVLESGRGAMVDVWHRIKMKPDASTVAVKSNTQLKED